MKTAVRHSSGHSGNHSSDDHRKMILLIVLLTIVIIASIAACIRYFFFHDDTGSSTNSVTTETDTDAANNEASESTVDSGLDLSDLDEEEQIETLIVLYRTAMAEADLETLKTLYQTDEIMNSDVITATAQIITGYENTTCYIKDGMEETSRVVFIYDELQIAGIDSLIPNIAYVYLMQDEDGDFYIYPGEYSTASSDYVYSTDIQKYISELISDKDITKLYTKVNEALTELMEEDEDVREFIESLTSDGDDYDDDTAETSVSESDDDTAETSVSESDADEGTESESDSDETSSEE